jgi:hypothetical protein
MPIHAIHPHANTFDHECPRCHTLREGLPIDPARGHLTVGYDHAGHSSSVTTSPCPTCLTHIDEWGEPVTCVESFRLHIPKHETGEAPHPESLVGHRFEDTGGIVTEHTHGYHLGEIHVTQARLIRALQAHPHLAPHAPLRDP